MTYYFGQKVHAQADHKLRIIKIKYHIVSKCVFRFIHDTSSALIINTRVVYLVIYFFNNNCRELLLYVSVCIHAADVNRKNTMLTLAENQRVILCLVTGNLILPDRSFYSWIFHSDMTRDLLNIFYRKIFFALLVSSQTYNDFSPVSRPCLPRK